MLDKPLARTLGKVAHLGEVYAALQYAAITDIPVSVWETDAHLYAVPQEADWRPAVAGTAWGGPGKTAWFQGAYEIPGELAGRKLYIQALVDGHETLFWVDGAPRGIFNLRDSAAQLGTHQYVLLTAGAEAGTRFALAFESYAGHPIVGTHPFQTYASGDTYGVRFDRVFEAVRVAECREDVRAFVYDVRTLSQVAVSPVVDRFRRGRIAEALLRVFDVVPQKPEEVGEAVWRQRLAEARGLMAPLLAVGNSASAPQAGLIGHSHMDTAWLWTRDEVIRKCGRTYANALTLMEQYPEYRFVQSSSFHAELMRRHYPAVFAGIRQRVAEGRWEPNGGTWIEPDCNMTSGESLVRQFLKGQTYTRRHFGYTADTFWLPDTFGYSAAIPQILHGVGIRYFLTTKLSWNDTNAFPYDSFWWQGLDGTAVLTHFNHIHCWPDAETLLDKLYGPAEGAVVEGVARNYIRHPHVNDRRLISYGFGDGGGGPHDGMLEAARRVADLEGVPRAAHTSVSRFMAELADSGRDLPVHRGELYLEGHRGTLTQMSRIKRGNRKAELALRELEFAEVAALLAGGGSEEAARAAAGADAADGGVDVAGRGGEAGSAGTCGEAGLPADAEPRGEGRGGDGAGGSDSAEAGAPGAAVAARAGTPPSGTGARVDERAAARAAEREELYETLLINQFHDILPGTSIPEVHDRAARELGEVIARAAALTAEAAAAPDGQLPDAGTAVTVWNSLSWARSEQILLALPAGAPVSVGEALATQRFTDLHGRARLAVGGLTLPALGSVTLGLAPAAAEAAGAPSPFRYDGVTLAAPRAVISFDKSGYIRSFLHKPTGRQLVGRGYPLNALLVGEDVPALWDNWDIDPDQQRTMQLQTDLVSRTVAADGPLQFRLRSTYRIGQHSTLRQDMVVYADSDRIDFDTLLDWRDPHRLLKVGFDVNLLAASARQEMQFGHVERPTHRNTSREQAMFEVCNHKWTDLSENRFGVALLNDCKYGISVEGSDMRLTLQKGGCHPDPRGDAGVHEFTYAFLPHAGGFAAETVIRPAYELNVPARAAAGAAAPLPGGSIVCIDAPNVLVEAVKPAEQDHAYVLRLYEAERSATAARLTFGRTPRKVTLTNLLEEELEPLPLTGDAVELWFNAFEIKTVKVYM